MTEIDVHLWAELVDHARAIRAELEQRRQAERSYSQRAVTLAPITVGRVSPASGNLYLELGGPPVGRVWELRRLTVGGPTWETTVAGSLDLLVMPSQPAYDGQSAAASLAMLIDHASVLPAVAFYSAGQVLLRPGERLYAVVYSPSVSTYYAASGTCLSYPDTTYPIVAQS